MKTFQVGEVVDVHLKVSATAIQPISKLTFRLRYAPEILGWEGFAPSKNITVASGLPSDIALYVGDADSKLDYGLPGHVSRFFEFTFATPMATDLHLGSFRFKCLKVPTQTGTDGTVSTHVAKAEGANGGAILDFQVSGRVTWQIVQPTGMELTLEA